MPRSQWLKNDANMQEKQNRSLNEWKRSSRFDFCVSNVFASRHVLIFYLECYFWMRLADQLHGGILPVTITTQYFTRAHVNAHRYKHTCMHARINAYIHVQRYTLMHSMHRLNLFLFDENILSRYARLHNLLTRIIQINHNAHHGIQTNLWTFDTYLTDNFKVFMVYLRCKFCPWQLGVSRNA